MPTKIIPPKLFPAEEPPPRTFFCHGNRVSLGSGLGLRLRFRLRLWLRLWLRSAGCSADSAKKLDGTRQFPRGFTKIRGGRSSTVQIAEICTD